MKEIPYSEFLRDIRQQKKELEVKKPPKEPWKVHREALSIHEYNHLTQFGERRLEKPRPVWLPDKKRWTVGAPVNPIEWQILLQSDPARGWKRVTEIDAGWSIMAICGQFWIHDHTFSECVDRLQSKHLLKIGGGVRRSRIADKWLFPDLTGQRAGGEWHRNSIRDFVDLVNRAYGCYTYVDRGYCPAISMPDVIIIRPRLVEHIKYNEPQREPLEWDWENPIYAEFKSAGDMREHPNRLEEQLDQYDGIPLWLKVEAKISKVKNMLEEHGRRDASLIDLLRKPEGDMVFLIGSERPRAEQSFIPVLERIKEAFRETYDRKARLRKTGVDPQGREYHDLILYDSLNTPKNVGQVIPNYAEDVEEFVDLFFDIGYLGCIITADYVYVPERKPTRENKTWKWNRTRTPGSKFRSFSG